MLVPTLATCLARNRARANDPLLGDAAVSDNDRGFFEGVGPEHRPFMIDNSELSPEETVDRLETVLERYG